VHQIIIDLENCEGCLNCYEACFVDVMRWDNETNRPVVQYPEECATCNWCELSCSTGAIQVIPDNPAPYPDPYPGSIYPVSPAT
jgi:NAD-dependent dihydropyrimidine dehydrogenase PreA subunit